MTFWGKIIGGICGLWLAGPIGLMLGIMVGHSFDRGLTQQRRSFGQFGTQNSQAQQTFFKSTFLVMGYIAKADGHVSEAEIQAARSVMNRLNLNETMRQQAIQYFTQGKQASFNLEQALTELTQSCHRNKVLLRMFVEIQMQAAYAEGRLSTTKQRILQTICQRLGFAPLNFGFFEDLFNFQQGQGHQQQSYHQQNYRRPGTTQLKLQDAYILLGISQTASDADVKRAYRRLMSQHHPDKLVSKGLPEEMIKVATEKTQNIKAAYERICEARGIK